MALRTSRSRATRPLHARSASSVYVGVGIPPGRARLLPWSRIALFAILWRGCCSLDRPRANAAGLHERRFRLRAGKHGSATAPTSGTQARLNGQERLVTRCSPSSGGRHGRRLRGVRLRPTPPRRAEDALTSIRPRSTGSSRSSGRSRTCITRTWCTSRARRLRGRQRVFFTMELVPGVDFLQYVSAPARAARPRRPSTHRDGAVSLEGQWPAVVRGCGVGDRRAAAPRRRIAADAAPATRALASARRGRHARCTRRASCTATSSRRTCW